MTTPATAWMSPVMRSGSIASARPTRSSGNSAHLSHIVGSLETAAIALPIAAGRRGRSTMRAAGHFPNRQTAQTAQDALHDVVRLP